MAISPCGGLSTAIPDVCRNYDPIKDQPTKVWSTKSGRLYKCRNFRSCDSIEGCLFCCNWVTPEGEYKNADPLFLYQENAHEFINYFKGRNHDEKRKIFREILDLEFVNKEVVSWLNDNEPKLVKEVGLEWI